MSLRRPNFQEENSAETINVSPLIDVIFILLIFFIVTMVFADGSAMKVDVPKAAAAKSVESKPLTIVILSDSSVLVDGKRVALGELERAIRRRVGECKSVVLRGDASAPVGTLVEVMDCAKACGAREIYVSADKK